MKSLGPPLGLRYLTLYHILSSLVNIDCVAPVHKVARGGLDGNVPGSRARRCLRPLPVMTDLSSDR